MSNLSAKFASALLLGTIAGAASTVLLPSVVRAADNCLLEPRDDKPQGKHWHYRIEHGTGRHCWYLRGEDEKSADAPSAADNPAPRRAEASTSRSIADAHAEIGPRTRVPGDAPAAQVAAQAAPSAWPSPAAAAPAATSATANAPVATPSPVASRWPQTPDASPAANAQPDASLMVADAADPDASNTQQSNTQDSTDPAAPPPSLAAAPVERNTGSIQKLMLVAVGALALAGLTGSAVYRLGRRRRRNDWLRERTNWQSMENPHDPPWVEPQFAHAEPNVPDLDEARDTAAHAEVSHAFEADETGDRVEKIEEFLARLTQQLHAEMESTQRTDRGARAAS